MKQATIANYSSMDVFCGTASPPNSTSVCPDIIQKYDINVSQVFRTTVHLLPAHYFELRCVNEFCIRSSYLLTLYRILESIFIGADQINLLYYSALNFILRQSSPCPTAYLALTGGVCLLFFLSSSPFSTGVGPAPAAVVLLIISAAL